MKHDKVYLSNILDAIERILDYTEGLSPKEFKEHNMIQDAVVRNFEIIGEATKNISSDLRNENSHIPWKNMAGMRDKLIHNYMRGGIWMPFGRLLMIFYHLFVKILLSCWIATNLF